MIYQVTSEIAIRKYLNDQLAENNEYLSSVLSRPLSPEFPETERDDTVRSVETSNDYLNLCMSLLDTALREGKASAFFNVDENYDGKVAFAVRDDGLIRCYESKNIVHEGSARSCYYSVPDLSCCYDGMKVAEIRRDQMHVNHDVYREAMYAYIVEYKKAVYVALVAAHDKGKGSSDVNVGGDIVYHIEAIPQDDKVVYTEFPVFLKYFE